MRYSYNYKRKAVELYRQGLWPDTPDGLKTEDFRKMIRSWSRIEESCGLDALRHKSQNKEWTPEERYALVSRVLAGDSIKNVAYSVGINNGQLYQWVENIRYMVIMVLYQNKKGENQRILL